MVAMGGAEDSDDESPASLGPECVGSSQEGQPPPTVMNPRTKETFVRHGERVPKSRNLKDEFVQSGGVAQSVATTLMIRNMPNRMGQKRLREELNKQGLVACFDFLYVPLDLRTMSNVGYAFVNFLDAESATKAMTALQNSRFGQSGKVLAVSVAHIQGLEANLQHYASSAVKHSKLKQRRPMVLPGGLDVEDPAEDDKA